MIPRVASLILLAYAVGFVFFAFTLGRPAPANAKPTDAAVVLTGASGRIEHGVDGLVYRSSAEALELLSDLRQSPATAAAMGRAGREKMRALLDAVRQERSYREFLVGSGQPRAAVERTGMTKVA